MNSKNIKKGINISVLILLLIFVLQNLEATKVKFLFFGFELPLIVLIFIVFFTGFFTAISFRKEEKKNDQMPL
jgi:uncharacterized integral membrane protein